MGNQAKLPKSGKFNKLYFNIPNCKKFSSLIFAQKIFSHKLGSSWARKHSLGNYENMSAKTRHIFIQRVRQVQHSLIFVRKAQCKKVESIKVGFLPTLNYWSWVEVSRGHILSCVWPFCEWAVSNLDRSVHRSQWV